MGAFALAIVAIMLMLLGIVIGARIGSELARGCVTRREYWMANLKIVLVGVLASALIGFTRLILLSGIPIGAMAGAIAAMPATLPPRKACSDCTKAGRKNETP